MFSFLSSYRQGFINFTETDGPVSIGNFAPEPTDSVDQVKVINWNIKFAERIDQAIEELSVVESLQDADIIILQEMDDEGVEKIAREFGYNYIYYPASIHNKTGRAFGNAVLSRWPIKSHQKIILPHESPTNRQRRILVKTIITIGDQDVAVFSVHTETPVLSRVKRNDQVERISEAIENSEQDCIIVAGDFNTFSSRSVSSLADAMAEVGLTPVLSEGQATVKTPVIDFNIDHLFTMGFEAEESGVWSGTAASDHYPIWVELTPCT